MSFEGGGIRPQDRTNTLAIVSFVSSFVIGVAGIVTGHMALRQIRRSGEGGRGLAIAGLVIGYVMASVTVLGVVAYIAVVASLTAAVSGPVAAQPPAATFAGTPSAEPSTPAAAADALEGPTPAHGNIHGGVTLLANTVLAKTDPATVRMADLPPAGAAVPDEVMAPGAEAVAGEPVKVVAYVDFICSTCKNFLAMYNPTLTQLRNEGEITVEYRLLGFLDSRSTTNYSSRAANAAACVANNSPEAYSRFFNTLYDLQPREGGAGLSDADLKKLATDVGAKNIDTCVDEETYRPYVNFTTQGAEIIGVTGAPTVLVEGRQWGKGDSAQVPFDEFLQTAIDTKK